MSEMLGVGFDDQVSVDGEDKSRLGKLLLAYEQKYDVSAKVMAERIGISESTYCRIKQGKMPDAQGLARIVYWMMH